MIKRQQNLLYKKKKILGDEYIVNTVSHKGVHRVTTIWKYYKKQTNDGNYIYDYMDSVNELDISNAEMVEYAYKVADAIGIEYGQYMENICLMKMVLY